MFFYFYGKLALGVCVGAENFHERSGKDYASDRYFLHFPNIPPKAVTDTTKAVLCIAAVRTLCAAKPLFSIAPVWVSRPRVYWTLIFNIFRGTRKRQQQKSVLQDETDVEFSFCFLLLFSSRTYTRDRGGNVFLSLRGRRTFFLGFFLVVFTTTIDRQMMIKLN